MLNERVPSIRIGYLVNQYPAVSHTFIRREILELEKMGLHVVRVALTGWNNVLVDAEDINERDKTEYVQKIGMCRLLWHAVTGMITMPVRFARACQLTFCMARRSNRLFPIHLFYLVEAIVVATLVKRHRISHLHAHFGTNSAEVAMLASMLADGTYSFTVHGPEEFDRAEAIGLREKIERSKFVVAISSFGRGQLYRWTPPTQWNKVKVVHCGLEQGFYRQRDVQPAGHRRFVCVGRLCEQKGQLLLVRAMHTLARMGLGCELVLVGDGEMRQVIDAEIAAHDLGGRIRLTGWLSGEQVREQLLDATALVLPSLAEGLPVVIMEAMALRRPVLSTYIAGIPELVQQGVNGWLFPSGSVEALASAMQDCLARSSVEIERMGDAAYQTVIHRHDITCEAQKLAEHFLDASIAQHAARSAS